MNKGIKKMKKKRKANMKIKNTKPKFSMAMLTNVKKLQLLYKNKGIEKYSSNKSKKKMKITKTKKQRKIVDKLFFTIPKSVYNQSRTSCTLKNRRVLNRDHKII